MIGLKRLPPSLDSILEEAGLCTGGPTRRGSSFWSAFDLCKFDAALIEKRGREYQQSFSPALITGFIVHECLAHWYKSYNVNTALAPLQYLLSWSETTASSEDLSEYARIVWECCQLARKLLSQYLSRPIIKSDVTIQELSDPLWDFSPDMVRMVEAEISYTGEFEYSARADLILLVRDVDGSYCVVIVDHKTLGMYTQNWTEAFWMDLQFVGLPFLWNEVMVPQGKPECRYIIANGIVKDPKAVKDRFVREVYPVRQSRVDSFKRQVKGMYAEYQQCHDLEAAAMYHHQQTGEGVLLDEVWRKSWPACQSRRYGRSYSSWIPKELGEHVPNGGRCHRYEYCLFEDANPEWLFEPTQISQPVVEASNKEVEPINEVQVESTQLVPQTSNLPEETGKALQDRDEFIPEFKVPMPESSSEIVSMVNAGEPVPVGQANPGDTIYVSGIIYWVVGVREDGARFVSHPDCAEPIVLPAESMCFLVTPVIKVKKEKVQKEPLKVEAEPVEVDPRVLGDVKKAVSSLGMSDDALPLSACGGSTFDYEIECNSDLAAKQLYDALVVGLAYDGPIENLSLNQSKVLIQKTGEKQETTPPQEGDSASDQASPPPKPALVVGSSILNGGIPLPGVGMVPVRYVGAFNQGGKKLHPNLANIWKEYPEPYYGAAMTGRDVQNRKLQLFVVKGDSSFESVNRTTVGTATWTMIEDGIKEILNV